MRGDSVCLKIFYYSLFKTCLSYDKKILRFQMKIYKILCLLERIPTNYIEKNKGDRNFTQNLLYLSLVIKTYAIFLLYVH